ncbi:MAG: lactate racemase domain-containing protein [Pirellulales bacterium]
MSQYPRIFRVRQHFTGPQVADIDAEVRGQLGRLPLDKRIRPGESVAVTAGSRGIANIAQIIRASVAHLKSIGAKPFIVPAMGSHGGGTAEGQVEILHGYGITEEYCGCPIRASMETIIVCQTREGFPVHFDKHASQADHVLVVGRIKPHTGFVGDIESGLMKMMLIGLGKHAGALVYHRAIQDYSFPQIVRSVAAEVIAKCKIVAGLGIVENEREETAQLAAVLPEELEAREKELLVLAKQWIPRLPFERCHMLMVDQIGKNISGTGMDTNVVGRKYNDHKAVEDEWPKVKVIAVRSLTEETHGNATGLGMAEFCRSRVLEQIDVKKTRINCLTGGHVAAGMTPFDYPTDREILRHRAADDRSHRSASRQAALGPQHARPRGSGMRRGVFARSAREGELGDSYRAASASIQRGRQLAGLREGVAMRRCAAI